MTADQGGAAGSPDVPLVHVLCVTHHSSRWLPPLLGSLDAEEVHAVLIWDNSDDPAERTRVREAIAEHRRAELVGGDRNIGFGPAVNRLVEHVPSAVPAVLWILNPDIEVPSGTVQRLLRGVRRWGPEALVSPVIRTGAHGGTVWFAGGELEERRARTTHWTDVGAPAPRQCTFVTGAALMVDAAAWRRLGGFREDLFLYWEDADLCRRALAAGWTLHTVDDAWVWHAVGGAGGEAGRSPTYYRLMTRNRLLLAREWTSLPSALAGPGGLETLRLLGRAVRERSGRWAKSWAALRGTWDGIRGRSGQVPVPPGPMRPAGPPTGPSTC